MPSYAASPINKHVQQASPGLPVYLLGSLTRTVAPTVMTVTAVQLTSPTAVISVSVKEGNVPVVGQLVSITGAVPSYFNVTNKTITAVSVNATTGIGTISFALTNSNVGTTTSPGLAVAPQIETGESLTSGASCAASIQSDTGPNNGRSIRFDVSFPILPGAAIVTAQSAVVDVDTEYQDLGTAASVTGGTQFGSSVIFPDITANFVRFNVTGLAASASATIIAKVTV